MRTTGPILAIGAVTMFEDVVLDKRPVDWRVPMAAGLAALAFGAFEKAWSEAAVSVAYLALFSSLFVSIGGRTPPIERLLDWWNPSAEKIIRPAHP